MFFIDVIIQWDCPYTRRLCKNPRRQHNKQRKSNLTQQHTTKKLAGEQRQTAQTFM